MDGIVDAIVDVANQHGMAPGFVNFNNFNGRHIRNAAV